MSWVCPAGRRRHRLRRCQRHHELGAPPAHQGSDADAREGAGRVPAGDRHRHRARHPVRRRRRHPGHPQRAPGRARQFQSHTPKFWPSSTAAPSRPTARSGWFRRPPTADGGNGGTLAFLEPGLVAIGDTATVKRAIDAQLTAASIRQRRNHDPRERHRAGNNAWAVGRFDVLAAHAKLPEQIAKQIPPVKWFAAAGTSMAACRDGPGRGDDDEAAELFRRQVNGALAFGEMVGRNDPRASAVLKRVQMSGRQDRPALVHGSGRAAPAGVAESSGCSNRAH